MKKSLVVGVVQSLVEDFWVVSSQCNYLRLDFTCLVGIGIFASKWERRTRVVCWLGLRKPANNSGFQ